MRRPVDESGVATYLLHVLFKGGSSGPPAASMAGLASLGQDSSEEDMVFDNDVSYALSRRESRVCMISDAYCRQLCRM